jgi:hypothetical protein
VPYNILRKVNAKQGLPKYTSRRTIREAKVDIHIFVTSALDERELYVSVTSVPGKCPTISTA